jgi:hypothetical protein
MNCSCAKDKVTGKSVNVKRIEQRYLTARIFSKSSQKHNNLYYELNLLSEPDYKNASYLPIAQ